MPKITSEHISQLTDTPLPPKPGDDAEFAMMVMPDYYSHLGYGITSLYLSGV